jgi:GT2 family glycosyltransferase
MNGADDTLADAAVEGSRHADCAVVIVTYNSADCIGELLRSLSRAAPGLRLRTVVVDNGSSDETVHVVRNTPGVTSVETKANLGYAGGINVGRSLAGSYSALLVLNPDVVLEEGSVARMHAALSDSAIGIVVPALVDPRGRQLLSLRREPTLPRAIGDGLLGSRIRWRPGWLSETVREENSYRVPHAVDWATGAVLLISAACDRAVGDWDERFFLYSEETDYAHRARAVGFRIQYLPSARAWHREGASGASARLVALMAVNRVRYAEKHRHPSNVYRLAVALHELLRARDSAHRTALRLVLNRRAWPALVEHLKGSCAMNGYNDVKVVTGKGSRLASRSSLTKGKPNALDRLI